MNCQLFVELSSSFPPDFSRFRDAGYTLWDLDQAWYRFPRDLVNSGVPLRDHQRLIDSAERNYHYLRDLCKPCDRTLQTCRTGADNPPYSP
jgi:hypothetical protein